MTLVVTYCIVIVVEQVRNATNTIGIMGFLNAAIDMLILLLPIRMVWTLQMSPKRKMAVSGIFALGTM